MNDADYSPREAWREAVRSGDLDRPHPVDCRDRCCAGGERVRRVSDPAGWDVARGALDASLKHDDAQLWVVADEAEQVDLELAFLAADRMVRVLEQVLNARQERWLAANPTARRDSSVDLPPGRV